MYVGVTLHKNSLGALAFVSAFFLLWDLTGGAREDWCSEQRGPIGRNIGLEHVLVSLGIADSATALVAPCWHPVLLYRFASVARRVGCRFGAVWSVLSVRACCGRLGLRFEADIGESILVGT